MAVCTFRAGKQFQGKGVLFDRIFFDMCLSPEFVWVCVYVTYPVQHYLYRKYTDLVKRSIHQELFLGVVIPVMPRTAGFQVLMKDTFKGSLRWLRFYQLYSLCQVVLVGIFMLYESFDCFITGNLNMDTQYDQVFPFKHELF